MKQDYKIEVFGDNLKRIRKSNGLSMNTMSKVLGIGVKSLSSLERGILPPRMSASILIKINNEFGFLPSEMFLKIDEKQKGRE